jgi:murein DD-endopeptidase MepM/ murein hydrolase activator NlpD
MTKTNLQILSLFIFMSFFNTAQAFPRNDLKPGGVAIIAVAPSSQKKPKVSYLSNPVALIKGKQNWLAIIGISLKAKKGKHQVFIKDAKGKSHTKNFAVKPFKYRTQRLTIRNKNKVNPNKKSQKRIEREFFLKKKLKKTYSVNTPHLNFIRPTSGRDSGRFGLRRILNKQKRNPHSGMDIAAPKGRSVKATESGTVLFAGDLFFTGKAIYLDHGNGLISLYAHLSKMNVKQGQRVKRGEIIAKVGKTGRATGPHLHWSVYLNGNAIDPSLFLTSKSNH